MGGTYGGEELNEQVWKWQKREKQVLIRVPSYRNVAAEGTDMYQSVLNSDYEAYIVAAYDKTLPEVRNQPESVQVIFTCGYATAADVPEDIKTWIKLCVGSLYGKRELESERQTYSLGAADQLLYRYKVYFA